MTEDPGPKLHPDAFTLENVLRFHEWIEAAYQWFNQVQKPLADRAITKLVAGKPVDGEQARKMLRPEDFATATASAAGGEWSFVRLVKRDPVIAALVSKAAATKAAIVHLAKGGFGADAYMLTRVLLENMIVVAWLLPEDVDERHRRIDTFILHMEAFLVRFEQITLRDHREFGTRPDPEFGTTFRTRELSSEVFEDRWMFWAWLEQSPGKKTLVRLKTMAQQVGLQNLYERDYFLMSSFIHSAPASVFEHSGGPADTISAGKAFAIRPELFTTSDFQTQAIGLTNTYMVHLLDLLNRRFDFGLKDVITMLYTLLLIDPAEWPPTPGTSRG